MNEKISYKKLETEDFEAFYEFFSKSLKELFPHYHPRAIDQYLTGDYSKETLQNLLKNGKKTAFLAYTDNKIIGFMLVSKTFGGVSFGNWLAVDCDYQNRGIGSKLLYVWEKQAEEDAHTLQVWTTDLRVNFYKRKGFTLVGNFPKAWFGVDHYLLFKLLQDPQPKHYLKD